MRLRLLALLSLTLAACSRTFPDAPAPRAEGERLSVSAERTAVPPGGSTQLRASGGQPPYTFSLAGADRGSGPGAGVDATGRYTAGPVGSVTDTVRVGDAAGATAAVTLTVGPALALVPQAISLAPGQTWNFQVAGGAPPYCYQLAGGPGCPAPAGPICSDADPDAGPDCPAGPGAPSCVDRTGLYRAGACGPATDLLTVTDALGAQRTATVRVGPALYLEPGPEALADLGPGELVAFLASGGVPPYQFSLAPGGAQSGATLGRAGLYRAGPNPDSSDRVVLQDAAGSRVEAAVHVGGPRVELPADGRHRLVRADFNGDGRDDLLALPRAGAPVAYLAVGSERGLQPATPLYLPELPRDAVVADFTGDGRADLAVVLHLDPADPFTAYARVELFVGQADGTLQAGPSLVLSPDSVDNVTRAGAWDLRNLGRAGAVLALPCTDQSGQSKVALASAEGGAWQRLGDLPVPDPAQHDLVQVAAGAKGHRLLAEVVPPGSACPGGPAATTAVALAEYLNLGPADGGASDGGLQAAPARVACAALPTAIQAAWEDLEARTLPWAASSETEELAVLARLHLGHTYLASFLRAGTGYVAGPALDLGPDVADAERGPSPLRPGYELDVAGPSGLRRLARAEDGGLAELAGLPGPAQSAAPGDYDHDGLPDLAVLAGAGPIAGRVQVLLGGFAGDLGVGRSFRTGQAPTGLAVQAGDGGPAALWLSGPAGALELRGQPGTGRLSLDGTGAPGAAGVAVLTLGEALWAAGRFEGDAGPELRRLRPALEDGGSAYRAALPDRPAYRLLPARSADGPGLLVQALDPSLEHPALAAGVLPLGPTGLPAAGPDLQDLGRAYEAVLVSGAGPLDDLVVLALQPNGDSVIALRPARADGGWADPASTLTSDDLFAFGVNQGLVAFSLQPGGPVDHLAGYNTDPTPGCLEFGLQSQWTAALQGGQLTVGNELPTSLTGVACFPVAYAPLAADVDRDGNTDLVLSNGATLDVLWGDGAGGFDTRGRRLFPDPASSSPPPPGERQEGDLAVGPFALGDLDGDGWLDLAYQRTDAQVLAVLRNATDGGFW